MFAVYFAREKFFTRSFGSVRGIWVAKMLKLLIQFTNNFLWLWGLACGYSNIFKTISYDYSLSGFWEFWKAPLTTHFWEARKVLVRFVYYETYWKLIYWCVSLQLSSVFRSVTVYYHIFFHWILPTIDFYYIWLYNNSIAFFIIMRFHYNEVYYNEIPL